MLKYVSMKQRVLLKLVTLGVGISFYLSLSAQDPGKTIFTEKTWTSADGKQTFVGSFTKIQNGKVTIVKDGDPLKFSIEKLSQEDRVFLGQGVTFSTQDGKSYENVSISKITASAITVMSSSGVAGIPMEQLPEDLRVKFGYDPEKAKLERDWQAKRQAEYQAQLAVQRAEARENAEEARLRREALAPLKPGQAKEKTVKIDELLSGGGSALADNWEMCILGLPNNLKEGSLWSGTLYYAGTFTYASKGSSSTTTQVFYDKTGTPHVAGSVMRTIDAWHTSKAGAFERVKNGREPTQR